MATETEINNAPAIEFRNVSLSFDEKRVLNDVSFKLERGEMIFITGVSGSGKSVLLRLAMALDQPDSGEVFIEGQDVGLLDEVELLKLRGGRMGIVFQEDSLFTGLSVYENVAYRLQEHGADENEIENAVMEVLRFVGLNAGCGKAAGRIIRRDAAAVGNRPGLDWLAFDYAFR
jgi:ABC-type transporter Mla maintaining outer membrane lipid asymmetry ATPase subunit MlaF